MRIGDGVTAHVGSDRYPYTIIQVVHHGKVIIQEDSFRRVDQNGLSEMQSYEFSPNPHGRIVTITLRSDRKGNVYWRQAKHKKNSTPFTITGRSAYLDPSF